jgi:hypothetical protein
VILIATRKELNLLGKACGIITIILSALLIFSSLYPSYLSVGIFFASKLHLFSTYSAAFVFLLFGAAFCAFTWFVTIDDNGSASRIPALVCGCFLLFVFAVGAALRMAYIAILPSHLFKAIGVVSSIGLLTFAILLILLAMFMGKGLRPRLKGAAVFSSVLSTALTAVAQALFLALIFQSPGPSHFAKPYTVLNALSLLSFGIVFLLFALLAGSPRIPEASG